MTLPEIPDRKLTMDLVAGVLEQMPDPSGGGLVEVFEREAATVFDSPYAVAVSSGTAAIHAALSALGIGPGDEVLVPALTVVMTVAPLAELGAQPVYVDSDPATFDLDYQDAVRKLTSRTKAIIPVHLWGRMGQPTALTAFAEEHGVAVVEDAAQAAGTIRDQRRAGTVGGAGCISMKDGKILWSGEGGIVLTAQREIAEHAAAFRSHWLPAPQGDTPLRRLATNTRIAAPLAAIALGNLRRLPELAELRRAQTRHLLNALDHIPGLRVIDPVPGEQWNAFAPLMHIGLHRPRAFAEHLARLGVPNSTGTFKLVPCDTRPFAHPHQAPCLGAAEILEHTLALVVSERDTESTLDRYAATIATEARTWQS